MRDERSEGELPQGHQRGAGKGPQGIRHAQLQTVLVTPEHEDGKCTMKPDGGEEQRPWLPCMRVQRARGDFRDVVNSLTPHSCTLALQRPALRCHCR